MATNRHTHTKQAKRASALGHCTIININNDARGGANGGGVSNSAIVTPKQNNPACVTRLAALQKASVGNSLVRHVAQTQISGTTLSKARNRDIFVCKSTVLMSRARRSAGQKSHGGVVREGVLGRYGGCHTWAWADSGYRSATLLMGSVGRGRRWGQGPSGQDHGRQDSAPRER